MEGGSGSLRGMRKLLGMMEMFIILILTMMQQVYTYVKLITYLKYVQFIILLSYTLKVIKDK